MCSPYAAPRFYTRIRTTATDAHRTQQGTNLQLNTAVTATDAEGMLLPAVGALPHIRGVTEKAQAKLWDTKHNGGLDEDTATCEDARGQKKGRPSARPKAPAKPKGGPLQAVAPMTPQTVISEAMKWSTTVSNFLQKHTTTLTEARAAGLNTPSVVVFENRLSSIQQHVASVQDLMLHECRKPEDYTALMEKATEHLKDVKALVSIVAAQIKAEKKHKTSLAA